jgi:hypothetical protein
MASILIKFLTSLHFEAIHPTEYMARVVSAPPEPHQSSESTGVLKRR